MTYRLLLVSLCALLLGACTTLSQQTPTKYPDSESQTCADFFTRIDQTISAAKVKDSQASRIQAYPYLRVNRFLSDFKNDQMSAASFDAWVDRLQELATEAWQIELNNLSSLDREKLSLDLAVKDISLNKTIRYCGDLLRKTDLNEELERKHLIATAKVADEYKTWQRLIGLYPLSAWAFRSGIDSWHEETNKLYAQELKSLSVQGKLTRYAPKNNKPLSSKEVSRIINESSQNKLNIPEPSKNDKQKLFNSFAPIFEIDTVTDNDRIGEVKLDKDSIPQINTNLAKSYQHISHTRIDNQILLQLNYSVWFSSRPKTSTFDMLGGHLDGITWRVTLLPNGKPLLFDTMHNCGCYHLFFPTQHAKILPQEKSLDEPVFIPQTLSLHSEERPIVRIAHDTHYIERIYFGDAIKNEAIHYQQTNSNELRSLKLSNNEYRSLYGEDGIIDSSKRGERYLFWPMGIPSPGAMRQWGHHATAFVGRRHFDDARLFEKYFSINKE